MEPFMEGPNSSAPGGASTLSRTLAEQTSTSKFFRKRLRQKHMGGSSVQQSDTDNSFESGKGCALLALDNSPAIDKVAIICRGKRFEGEGGKIGRNAKQAYLL